jgi:hypothetical protein
MMLKHRIEQWGLDNKRLKEAEFVVAKSIIRYREAQGKDSVVKIRGRRFDRDHMEKYEHRKRQRKPNFSWQQPVKQLVVRTPSPEPMCALAATEPPVLVRHDFSRQSATMSISPFMHQIEQFLHLNSIWIASLNYYESTSDALIWEYQLVLGRGYSLMQKGHTARDMGYWQRAGNYYGRAWDYWRHLGDLITRILMTQSPLLLLDLCTLLTKSAGCEIFPQLVSYIRHEAYNLFEYLQHPLLLALNLLSGLSPHDTFEAQICAEQWMERKLSSPIEEVEEARLVEIEEEAPTGLEREIIVRTSENGARSKRPTTTIKDSTSIIKYEWVIS